MYNQKHPIRNHSCSRRDFVKTSSAVASAGLLSACGVREAYREPSEAAISNESVRPLSKQERNALTPDQIIQRAKEGNNRFRAGRDHFRPGFGRYF